MRDSKKRKLLGIVQILLVLLLPFSAVENVWGQTSVPSQDLNFERLIKESEPIFKQALDYLKDGKPTKTTQIISKIINDPDFQGSNVIMGRAWLIWAEAYKHDTIKKHSRYLNDASVSVFEETLLSVYLPALAKAYQYNPSDVLTKTVMNKIQRMILQNINLAYSITSAQNLAGLKYHTMQYDDNPEGWLESFDRMLEKRFSLATIETGLKGIKTALGFEDQMLIDFEDESIKIEDAQFVLFKLIRLLEKNEQNTIEDFLPKGLTQFQEGGGTVSIHHDMSKLMPKEWLDDNKPEDGPGYFMKKGMSQLTITNIDFQLLLNIFEYAEPPENLGALFKGRNSFNYMAGEGYARPVSLQIGMKDAIFRSVDLLDVALFFLPMAELGNAAKLTKLILRTHISNALLISESAQIQALLGIERLRESLSYTKIAKTIYELSPAYKIMLAFEGDMALMLMGDFAATNLEEVAGVKGAKEVFEIFSYTYGGKSLFNFDDFVNQRLMKNLAEVLANRYVLQAREQLTDELGEKLVLFMDDLEKFMKEELEKAYGPTSKIGQIDEKTLKESSYKIFKTAVERAGKGTAALPEDVIKKISEDTNIQEVMVDASRITLVQALKDFRQRLEELAEEVGGGSSARRGFDESENLVKLVRKSGKPISELTMNEIEELFKGLFKQREYNLDMPWNLYLPEGTTPEEFSQKIDDAVKYSFGNRDPPERLKENLNKLFEAIQKGELKNTDDLANFLEINQKTNIQVHGDTRYIPSASTINKKLSKLNGLLSSYSEISVKQLNKNWISGSISSPSGNKKSHSIRLYLNLRQERANEAFAYLLKRLNDVKGSLAHNIDMKTVGDDIFYAARSDNTVMYLSVDDLPMALQILKETKGRMPAAFYSEVPLLVKKVDDGIGLATGTLEVSFHSKLSNIIQSGIEQGKTAAERVRKTFEKFPSAIRRFVKPSTFRKLPKIVVNNREVQMEVAILQLRKAELLELQRVLGTEVSALAIVEQTNEGYRVLDYVIPDPSEILRPPKRLGSVLQSNADMRNFVGTIRDPITMYPSKTFAYDDDVFSDIEAIKEDLVNLGVSELNRLYGGKEIWAEAFGERTIFPITVNPLKDATEIENLPESALKALAYNEFLRRHVLTMIDPELLKLHFGVDYAYTGAEKLDDLGRTLRIPEYKITDTADQTPQTMYNFLLANSAGYSTGGSTMLTDEYIKSTAEAIKSSGYETAIVHTHPPAVYAPGPSGGDFGAIKQIQERTNSLTNDLFIVENDAGTTYVLGEIGSGKNVKSLSITDQPLSVGDVDADHRLVFSSPEKLPKQAVYESEAILVGGGEDRFLQETTNVKFVNNLDELSIMHAGVEIPPEQAINILEEAPDFKILRALARQAACGNGQVDEQESCDSSSTSTPPQGMACNNSCDLVADEEKAIVTLLDSLNQATTQEQRIYYLLRLKTHLSDGRVLNKFKNILQNKQNYSDREVIIIIESLIGLVDSLDEANKTEINTLLKNIYSELFNYFKDKNLYEINSNINNPDNEKVRIFNEIFNYLNEKGLVPQVSSVNPIETINLADSSNFLQNVPEYAGTLTGEDYCSSSSSPFVSNTFNFINSLTYPISSNLQGRGFNVKQVKDSCTEVNVQYPHFLSSNNFFNFFNKETLNGLQVTDLTKFHFLGKVQDYYCGPKNGGGKSVYMQEYLCPCYEDINGGHCIQLESPYKLEKNTKLGSFDLNFGTVYLPYRNLDTDTNELSYYSQSALGGAKINVKLNDKIIYELPEIDLLQGDKKYSTKYEPLSYYFGLLTLSDQKFDETLTSIKNNKNDKVSGKIYFGDPGDIINNNLPYFWVGVQEYNPNIFENINEFKLAYSALALQHPLIQDKYFDQFKNILMNNLVVEPLDIDPLANLRPMVATSLYTVLNTKWDSFTDEEKIKILASAINSEVNINDLVYAHTDQLLNIFNNADATKLGELIIKILDKSPVVFYNTNKDLMIDLLNKLVGSSQLASISSINTLASIASWLFDNEFEPNTQLKLVDTLEKLKGSTIAFDKLKRISTSNEYLSLVSDAIIKVIAKIDPGSLEETLSQRQEQPATISATTPESKDICLLPTVNIGPVMNFNSELIIPTASIQGSQNVKFIFNIYDEKNKYVARLTKEESLDQAGKFVELPFTNKGKFTIDVVIKNDQGIIGYKRDEVLVS